jgi:hypothetical protein
LSKTGWFVVEDESAKLLNRDKSPKAMDKASQDAEKAFEEVDKVSK